MLISKQFKNNYYKVQFNRIEKFKKLNKFLFIFLLNKNIPIHLYIKNKILFFKFLKKLNKKYLRLITRRCLFSNRNRGVFRPFNLSRLVLRNLIQFGSLPGYKKSI